MFIAAIVTPLRCRTPRYLTLTLQKLLRRPGMVGRREFHTHKSGRFDAKSVVAGARWRIRLLTPVAVVLAIFAAWARPATAEQQPQAYSFQVARNDSANAEALANQLAALSPRVNRDEANRLA